MKNSMHYFTLLFTLAYLSSCGQSGRYDTSTPEKFIVALGQVGAAPKEENPVPSFYVKDAAAAITDYDEAGVIGIAAFQKFKNSLFTAFPDKVESMEANKIKVYADDEGMMTLSFSLSGSNIRSQIQDRKPEDYAFISATEPNADGVVTITCTMLGRQTDLEVKKEGKNFKMFMDQDNLQKLNDMAVFFKSAKTMFDGFQKEIDTKILNEANYNDKITLWSDQFIELLATIQ